MDFSGLSEPRLTDSALGNSISLLGLKRNCIGYSELVLQSVPTPWHDPSRTVLKDLRTQMGRPTLGHTEPVSKPGPPGTKCSSSKSQTPVKK